MQIAQIAQMESPTMTSTSERLARIRSDFARLHAAWFGDLMTLRRDGVLEHTWCECRNRSVTHAGRTRSQTTDPSIETRRRAA